MAASSESGAACMYCLESIETLEMPCMLPCSHISCLSCLKADIFHNGTIACPWCRLAIPNKVILMLSIEFFLILYAVLISVPVPCASFFVSLSMPTSPHLTLRPLYMSVCTSTCMTAPPSSSLSLPHFICPSLTLSPLEHATTTCSYL